MNDKRISEQNYNDYSNYFMNAEEKIYPDVNAPFNDIYGGKSMNFRIDRNPQGIFDLSEFYISFSGQFFVATDAPSDDKAFITLEYSPLTQFIESCALFINDNPRPIEEYQSSFRASHYTRLFTRFSLNDLHADNESSAFFPPLMYPQFDTPAVDGGNNNVYPYRLIGGDTHMGLVYEIRRNNFLYTRYRNQDDEQVVGKNVDVNRIINLKYLFDLFTTQKLITNIDKILINIKLRKSYDCILHIAGSSATLTINDIFVVPRQVIFVEKPVKEPSWKIPMRLYSTYTKTLNVGTNNYEIGSFGRVNSVILTVPRYSAAQNLLDSDPLFVDNSIREYNISLNGISFTNNSVNLKNSKEFCRNEPYLWYKRMFKKLNIYENYDKNVFPPVTFNQGFNNKIHILDNPNEETYNRPIYFMMCAPFIQSTNEHYNLRNDRDLVSVRVIVNPQDVNKKGLTPDIQDTTPANLDITIVQDALFEIKDNGLIFY